MKAFRASGRLHLESDQVVMAPARASPTVLHVALVAVKELG